MNWKDGYDIPALLGRVDQLRNPLESDLYLPVLTSAADFDHGIPDEERIKIVRGSVDAVRREGELNSDALKVALARGQASYLELPKSDMILVTSISLLTQVDRYTRQLEGAKLIFSPRLPKRFHSPWVTARCAQFGVSDHPPQYTKVRITLRARNTREAMNNGFLALDFFRGIWNFILGRRRFTVTLMGLSNKPSNNIVLGPLFSVHAHDGKLVEEELGVISDFVSVASFSNADAIERVRVAERKIRSTLAHIDYAEDLRQGFVRYARALDEKNSGSCLLAVWSLIEYLTGTQPRESSDKAIKRVARLFEPREPQRSVLRHLRDHRNFAAHPYGDKEFGEHLVSQAKYFAETLLDFHLARGRHFQSLHEACEFLDLPTDAGHLRRQIYLRKLAHDLRSRAGMRQARSGTEGHMRTG